MGNEKIFPKGSSSPSGDGKSLPEPLKHKLETTMNAHLSDVRVHEGHEATRLNANAFTEGNNIFFAPGKFQPYTEAGDNLIAHEVSHLIQQEQVGKETHAVAEGLVIVSNESSLE